MIIANAISYIVPNAQHGYKRKSGVGNYESLFL